MNEPFLSSNLVDLQDLDNEIFKLIAEKSEGESVNLSLIHISEPTRPY